MRRGFTLLEIIFTLVLVGVLLWPTLTMLNRAVAAVNHNSLMREAVDLAASILEAESYAGALSGVAVPPNFQVSKVYTEINPGIAKQVAVQVTWRDNLRTDNSIVLTRNYFLGID